jgi:hypothetical protein
MPKPNLSLAGLALTTLLATPAAGQSTGPAADLLFEYGRREPAVGARMAAMGGAAVAGLGDWSAAVANPAGLGYLQSRQAVTAGHLFHEEIERAGPFLDEEAEGITLGAVGFAAPVPVARGALAFGGGYAERSVYAVYGGSSGGEVGWLGEVSAAGAVAMTPRLMGGLALNGVVGDGGLGENVYGVSGRGGLSLALAYGVRLGLTVETPTYLRVELPPQLDLGELRSDEVRLTTPWRLAFGFLAGSETVLVTADVEVVDWSQARFDADGDPDLAQANAVADAFFRTVIHSRVGAEARLGPVALRVGAAFQPDPRFDGPVPEAVWQQYGLGAGIALHPQARLDLAFVHTRDEAAGSLVFEGAVRNALQAGVDVRF